MSDQRSNPEGLRLYRATAEVVFYVAARDEREAARVADEVETWEMMDGATVDDPILSPVRSASGIEAEWLNSIPFTLEGDNEEGLTCGDILAHAPALTEAELEAAGQEVLL